jgi:hypothetical protein
VNKGEILHTNLMASLLSQVLIKIIDYDIYYFLNKVCGLYLNF